MSHKEKHTQYIEEKKQIAKKAAKKYAPGMKVVPVTSFDEAVKYLQTHK